MQPEPTRLGQVVIGDCCPPLVSRSQSYVFAENDRNNRCKPIRGDDVSRAEESWCLGITVNCRLSMSKFYAS